MSDKDYAYSRIDVDYSNRTKQDLERPYKDIADRIEVIRIRERIMKKDFANVLGVSTTTLSRVTNGIRYPDPKILDALYYKYKVDMNWLLYGKE